MADKFNVQVKNLVYYTCENNIINQLNFNKINKNNSCRKNSRVPDT